MIDDIKKTVGYWYLFLFDRFGTRDKDSSGSTLVMGVLAQWIAFTFMMWLFLFSRYVLDIIGMYIALWPPANGFRNPSNPMFHIGLLILLIAFVVAQCGYKHLVDAGVVLKYKKMTVKRFFVFMAFAFWPLLVLMLAVFFNNIIMPCIVHALTIAYFYKNRHMIHGAKRK